MKPKAVLPQATINNIFTACQKRGWKPLITIKDGEVKIQAVDDDEKTVDDELSSWLSSKQGANAVAA